MILRPYQLLFAIIWKLSPLQMAEK